MLGGNLRVHRQRLRGFVLRDFDGNRRLVRAAWEWRERGVSEKNASRPHLEHPIADDVLRWFEFLSLGHRLEFQSLGAISEIAEDDLVVIPPANVTETHPFARQRADVIEQLRT